MTDPWLSAVQLSAATRSTWAGEPGAPAPGQVWRARWEGAGLLVLLLDVSRSHVLAAPVTADPATADDAAALLPAAATTIESELFVWVHVRRELPTRVLDCCLGGLTAASGTTSTLDVLHPSPRSARAADPLHPSFEERARLEDEMEALAGAAWAPAGTGEIQQLLGTAGVSANQVRRLPGVKPAEALAIRRGERPLAGPQVDALVELTGTPAATWWAANPELPADLVDELDQPSARRWIVALAADEGVDELDERRRVAYEVYALAARQTGRPSGVDWAGRIRQYLTARHQG